MARKERPLPDTDCIYCNETVSTADILDSPSINTTWQQWECPCCGNWNDRGTK